ncbi:MAG: YbaN family protein [Gammaproteobacteria bacterium]|nr:YbaN family protein [Gammaproteobacteria bacterium]
MNKTFKNHVLIALGWFFIVLGIIGALLPILPTTPFLILALALFSKSSPRFHQMLLNNKWFGPVLKEWEEKKTVSRQTKYKSTLLVIVSFSVSILLMAGKSYHQLMLLCLAVILLYFIWKTKEEARD